MSFYNKASLLTIPTAYKQGKLYSVKPDDGSGDFTFTRSTSATRVNEAGLIEKERENLLLYSNQFDTTWALTGATSITGGQAGYDGSSDAWLLETSSSAGSKRVQQSISVGGVKSYSVYAKAGTANFLIIGGAVNARYFDLVNGSVGVLIGPSSPASIESVGNGWYRCTMIEVGTTSAFQLYVADADGSTSTSIGDNIYIQDAQLEAGLVATDYIETTTSTVATGIVENIPRIDYSSGTPALLLEPQRTNLINYSEYFDATEWNNPTNTRNCIITKTNDINPAGEASAYSYEATGSFNQIAYLNSSSTGTTITNSIYVKRVTGTGNVILRDVNNVAYNFSLDIADGWKRIDTTAVINSSTVRFYLNLQTSGDKILIWGAQQEEGSYATSYIPTYGTSVTRVDDKTDILDLGITGQDVTHFVELDNNLEYARDVGSTSLRWSDVGTNSGALRIYRADVDERKLNVVFQDINGNFPFNIVFINTDNAKVAIKRVWSTGEIKVFVNGVLELSDTSTDFSTWNKLEMEGRSSSISVKSLLTFPTALTDAECITLTTI